GLPSPPPLRADVRPARRDPDRGVADPARKHADARDGQRVEPLPGQPSPAAPRGGLTRPAPPVRRRGLRRVPLRRRRGRDDARVLRLAGASYRLEALQDDAFAPGSRLELVPEPENEHDPHAIAVWDAERRLQAGYVPAEAARELGLPLQAFSLWEWREGGQRVGLRLLVAPAE